MCKKTKSADKGDPKKSGNRVEEEMAVEQEKVGLKISFIEINRVDPTFSQIDRKTLVLRSALQANLGSLCCIRRGRY